MWSWNGPMHCPYIQRIQVEEELILSFTLLKTFTRNPRSNTHLIFRDRVSYWTWRSLTGLPHEAMNSRDAHMPAIPPVTQCWVTDNHCREWHFVSVTGIQSGLHLSTQPAVNTELGPPPLLTVLKQVNVHGADAQGHLLRIKSILFFLQSHSSKL